MTREEIDAENEALQRAYSAVFGSPIGKIVLEDLARFCRAVETTFDVDPRRHALLEGRRETFLRIQSLSSLTPDEVLQLVARRLARASKTGDA